VNATRARIDFKRTEDLLISQPYVLDASVWSDGARLMAHVTVSDLAQWDERTLRLLCAQQLGLEHTPNEILLLSARAVAA
jgi:hypothetical protein